ncbi:MAG: hypothetical protein BM563_01020 [Bacteroidetes bacterium MedPE-SWsnd-G1]|nr:MAG: hypothetical protein BM563_01020 [Bacteroidetes bacterium MedPE-SWsnd-G1]
MKDFIGKMNFVLILCLFISCGGSGDDGEFEPPTTPEDIIPSNLEVVIEVIGVDASNPNGDGSGKIEVTASADDAINYEFTFGYNDVVESSSGLINYEYIDKGLNNFIIKVSAISVDDKSISTSKSIQVFVNDDMELVWSDEFDVAGVPNDSNWDYNIGTGSGGWGNSESQYYTDRSDNVKIEDGLLKIIAKKESFSGASYTSARLLTQDKYEFTYGKVEVKAKLPEGGGTWPAIWMLGANIDAVSWPACGEIDIMEHVGNNQNVVSSALHNPSSFGNTTNKGEKTIATASSEFHVYAVDWMPKKMVFSVDGIPFYTYSPGSKNTENWPYTEDQFIILNVAMGGSFGGAIDPSFIESTMEVDYVRVYQK